MKRFICTLAIVLMSSLAFADGVSSTRSLPLISSSECTVPANIHGQAAAEAMASQVREEGRVFRGAFGGCGQWDLTPEQRSNLPALLLSDIQMDQSDAECKLLNSSNEDQPFGLTANILCWKTIREFNEDLIIYLVTGVLVDADGEVATIMVYASDKHK